MSPTPDPHAVERVTDAILAMRDAGAPPRGAMLDRLLDDPWTLTLDLRLLLGALVLVAVTAVAAVYIDRSARATRERADYDVRRAFDAYDRERVARLTAEASADLIATLPPPPPPPSRTED